MVKASGRVELVGRDDAVDQVRAWAAGLDDGASCLAITGEPGIGKSTLWQVAAEAAGARGARVLAARPVEAELPLAYAALADLLADAVAPLHDALPAAQRDALSGALGTGLAPGGPIGGLAVSRGALTAVQLLSEASPVVLAIDDVQWLDPSSARVLGYVARRLGATRCSMLIGLRDGHPDPLDAAGAFGAAMTRIELGGLSLGAIAHIVRPRVSADLSRHRIARIHRRAAGNPFHALQLARARDDELPETLVAGLNQRLEEAPSAATAVLETLAVRGPLPAGALADESGLDTAIAAGLVAEDGELVRFDHPLLAEAAYRRIPPGRRRALHAEAAAAAVREQDVARHLALATAAPDRATAEFLASVAWTERMRGAPEVAAELAGHARRIMPAAFEDAVARIALDEAGYLFLAADEGSASALVGQIIAGPARGAVRAAALVQHALTRTDAAEAVASLELAFAEPHDDAVLAARTLAQLAWQRGAWQGDVEAALPEAERAVAMAEETGDQAALATALTTHALLLSFARGVGAEVRFRKAVEILQRTPTEPGDHTPHMAFAHERFWRGYVTEADALFELEHEKAVDSGDDGIVMRVLIFRAELETRRGRWDEAGGLLEEALVNAQGYWRLTALIRRGVIRGRRGDQAALEDAAELADPSGAGGDDYFAAAADYLRGLVALAADDVATAAPLLAALPEAMAEHPARAAEVAVYIPTAVAALSAAGDIERGKALAALLARRMAILKPWGRAALEYCLGILDLSQGVHDAAVPRLDAAAASFAALGLPWDHAQALLALGMTHRRAGRRSKAGYFLEQAASIFAGLRAEPARRAATDELRRARPRPSSDDRLTEAERRVAALAAEGRTNREIAAELFTGATTVEAHLTRIYSKLGIRSRTELARRVSEGTVALDGEPPEAPRSSATRA